MFEQENYSLCSFSSFVGLQLHSSRKSIALREVGLARHLNIWWVSMTTCWAWIGASLGIQPLATFQLLLWQKYVCYSRHIFFFCNGRYSYCYMQLQNWCHLCECHSKLPYISFDPVEPAHNLFCFPHISEDLFWLTSRESPIVWFCSLINNSDDIPIRTVYLALLVRY